MRVATSIIGNIPISLSRNNELHCKVCSPNFYDFKFIKLFSPIFIILVYLFSPSTDSLKNSYDYFLNAYIISLFNFLSIHFYNFFIKYKKLPPGKEKVLLYQPELRSPVAIPLIVVWISFS